ncbi:hypothetical protein [Streptomyces sp. NBC_00582]|uniref:hypothetical protein n=1 Tax=Streptomyces sp. NBC_00582 TaxID=2975783 RepID=UPI002E801126|nr:hypothetical protein [Streptomyces sp. NBC_00582]WUB58999.1 hypothetical protein OG852_00295 [Streptomyces sp. NBC_00582]WUB67728.1 hypothetical protein OG852_48840 [Streptomyces sp. NBC_00582]
MTVRVTVCLPARSPTAIVGVFRSLGSVFLAVTQASAPPSVTGWSPTARLNDVQAADVES